MMINSSYNGSKIKGDAVMLSKYGDIYNVIDNAYHPNPGLAEDDYPEIERCVDWLVDNKIKATYSDIVKWLKCRVARSWRYAKDVSINELAREILYSDLYDPCLDLKEMIFNVVNDFSAEPSEIDFWSKEDEVKYSERIADYINEKFLRVRAGGKLNPEGTDSIYFRISSHGYDWHRNIVDFLWEVFKGPRAMPRRIWIGHDAETNPPEITLFDGTPDELFGSFDSKIFEDFKRNTKRLTTVNIDRESFLLNQRYFNSGIENKRFYKVFE